MYQTLSLYLLSNDQPYKTCIGKYRVNPGYISLNDTKIDVGANNETSYNTVSIYCFTQCEQNVAESSKVWWFGEVMWR